MSMGTSRRNFLKLASAATVPALLTRRGWAQGVSANSQITLGCIGLGIHGYGWNMDAFLKVPEARIIAVCDVYANRRTRARAKVNNAYGNGDCETHADFREILARDDIDAVVISTPDHWHVMMAVMAARAGKDVFCEKPTLNVHQGQILVDTMTETGIVYQGGIEDRSVEQYYQLARIVRDGRLGKLNRIEVTLPAGEVFPKEEEAPVPEGLDYDMWLGPAPKTPYTPSKTGAQQWRNVWDYSGGKLTDWGAHLIDTAQVAMGEERGGPLVVDGKGTFPENALSTTATEYEIHYQYANDVEMVVKSGGTGIRFEGSEGWAECPSWRADLAASDEAILRDVPEEKGSLWKRPETEHVDFIRAVQDRSTPIYPPEDIHHLSNAMHLANISMRLGRSLKWDQATETIAGDEEANAMLTAPIRAPWRFDA